VYITENGTSDSLSVENGRVQDMNRQRYLELYLKELSQAIAEGSDVRGYFIWTLMDNFEWAKGYSMRMGIIHVDHATQKRTIKDSAYWVREMIRSQGS
jgi:beta-glucosidase